MFSKILFVGLLPPFILASVAHAQSFPREKLGDTELTCQALYEEVKEMDAVTAANAPGQGASGQQNPSQAVKAITDVAARESRSAEVAQFSNLLGRLTAGFGQDQQQADANKALARDSALVRKQYLTSLFNSKKCKLSALRK